MQSNPRTPPRIPGGSSESRPESSQRPRLDRTNSDVSEDGAMFLGHAPPRTLTPQQSIEELAPTRHQAEAWAELFQSPRQNSNISEDGAPFLGQLITRPETPQLRVRRQASAIAIQHVTNAEDEAPLPSPMERLIHYLEGRFIEGPWTAREQREFWKRFRRASCLALGAIVVKELNAPGCIPIPRADLACPPTPQYPSVANEYDPNWIAAVVPLPPSPFSPNFAENSILSPRPGVPASQIWTFNPSALSKALPSIPHPVTLLGSLAKFLGGTIVGRAGGEFGKAVVDKGTKVIASKPDIHGWDAVVTNQKKRGDILEALKNLEEVSSSLHVQLSSQLFAIKSGDASDKEHISSIKTFEAVQTQLEELKTHQSKIVSKLGIYHKAAYLASTALESHLLFANSRPTALADLHSLRTSMINTGTQLLDHINAAEQNIAFITRLADTLPWKTQRRVDWWARWVDGWKYRDVEEAFVRLEHLSIYVNVVRGMVTSDVLALK